MKPIVAFGVLVALAATAQVGGAGVAGPHFTAELEPLYYAGDRVDASGAGCPPEGGEPSLGPARVVVFETVAEGHPEDDTSPFHWVDGEILISDEERYVYAPVAADGTWVASIVTLGTSPPDGAVRGLCTNLLVIAEDGVSFEPSSIAAATFMSEPYRSAAILHSTTTTTTTTGPPSTTTTEPPIAPGPALPVTAQPTFTG